MKKVFLEVASLDKRCYENFCLSEDLLMENAAISLLQEIKRKKAKTILIVSGFGNNGADGIALSRMLHESYRVFLYLPFGVKNNLSNLQLQRAKKVGVKQIDKIIKADIVVDCLFGSGLNRKLSDEANEIIKNINQLKSYIISCDIPSGLNQSGQALGKVVKANTTITMGAYKLALLSDEAKDYVGKIKVANLGVSEKIYQNQSNYFLLQKKDLKLPLRKKQNSHKGSFGHLSVMGGDLRGASILSAKAAFKFGAGLVSIITKEKNLPSFIMSKEKLPQNQTALIAGMGMSYVDDLSFLNTNVTKLIDASLLLNKDIIKYIDKNTILSPHPKEFCALYENFGLGKLDIKTLQNNRFLYAKNFTKHTKATLILKGANTIIAKKQKLFICNMGKNNLAKGGSGDVLSGFIGALLAQKYSPLSAAINAVLAHSLISKYYKYNSYYLNPNDIIKGLKNLKVKHES